MKIPAYWARATSEATDGDGQAVRFSCWRSSDLSQQDAHQTALAAAQRIVASLLRGGPLGRYPYAEAGLREEVLQRFTAEDGSLTAVVTQNNYGALVLATSDIMFVDVDFPPIGAGEQLRYAVGAWFNRGRSSPEQQREDAARACFERLAGETAGFCARLYRSCAGLRAIVTHDRFDPVSDATQAIFTKLGADPLYMRLCRSQQCFRARLTPKPWRCGHTANTIAWPREADDQRARFEQWQAEYVERQSNYATCRFLGTIGAGQPRDDVATIIDIHDRTARCHDALQLA